MTESTVILQKQDNGVAYLILNRPQKRNAFDAQMIQQLIDQMNEFRNDDSTRCLVISAKGDYFSAGADLAWLQCVVNEDQSHHNNDSQQLAHLMQTVDTFPKPTIAMINGSAFGGALGVIACCDIAVAVQNATFCLSEVKLGLMPAVIGPYVMRSIGFSQCRRYFMTAEAISATQAKNIGLIHEVCSKDELTTMVTHISNTLLANAPNALTKTKRFIRSITNTTIDDQLMASCVDAIATLRVSEEGQEGLSAFLEKRQPNWIKTQGDK